MQKETIRLGLIDDHTLVRQTWKMLLQIQQEIEVVLDCDSGPAAISCLHDARPDVVLLDINMSPMNGFETAQHLLKLNSELKVIGISVNDQPSYAKRMLKIGAHGYVTKNSNANEMITAIKEVMKGNQYICSEVSSKMNLER